MGGRDIVGRERAGRPGGDEAEDRRSGRERPRPGPVGAGGECRGGGVESGMIRPRALRVPIAPQPAPAPRGRCGLFEPPPVAPASPRLPEASLPGDAPDSQGYAPYAVGIVNYRTYGDLERCLTRVKAQALAPRKVIVVDVDPEPISLLEMRWLHPEVVWCKQPNRGFAAGANVVLRTVAEQAPDAAYVLLLNPDVELDPFYAERVVHEMERRPRAALGVGKLLRPDTGRIDSAGIVLPRHRRPRDRASERLDGPHLDETEYVFGGSGAALMLRRATLPALAIEGEVFDEDFFLYHEDTDLSWRANLLGFGVLYVGRALAFHGRRWRRDRRFQIAAHVRRHSFKNHYLQIIKNEEPGRFLRILPVVAAWELARLGYALLRDREILPAYLEAARLAPRAWRKRRILRARQRRLQGGHPQP